MKPAFRIILALSFSVVACGHAKPDLFLDQATTALECVSSNAPDCAPSRDADAGPPRSERVECYGDGDCEDGEVCERRHGVSLCQPEDGHHAEDDGYGGHRGDDHPDAGAAGCDRAYAADDHPKGDDDCNRDGGHDPDPHDDRHDDRSGSNSGPH